MATARQQRNGERGSRIVREIGTQRWAAATRALEAAGERLGRVLSASTAESMWAQLLSSRVLTADDRRGHELGLVVQHDELRWASGISPVLTAIGTASWRAACPTIRRAPVRLASVNSTYDPHIRGDSDNG